MPVRLAWEPSPVAVVTSGDDHDVPMDRARRRPHRQWCHCRHRGRRCDATSRREPQPAADIPETVIVPTTAPQRRARRALAALAADGETARWEAMIGLEPNVRAASGEPTPRSPPRSGRPLDGTCRLLDHIDHQALADWMLLGDAGTTDPPAARPADRTLLPAVDLRQGRPEALHDSALRVYATEAIRRAVGDPHVGPKVRAAAAQLGTTDVDDVLAFYRRRRPGDRLGRRRAEAALDILRRPTGPPVPFAAPEAS